ncbi:sensor histidine kinase [Anaeropeptidivorans aminofermentans]|uniref:sensor histidine kinase n=1 Tax=Anaeropeptidivorans aminofermentans TaxID=2934315 RepID=UPI002024B29F|nr:HAMP domain-containing sensor histidine kinase [Anaeropeptidivorans aminofermentans]
MNNEDMNNKMVCIEPYENAIHDIKTALTIIYSINQLMDFNNSISDDVRKNLNIIKRNCLRAIKIINDVSDTTKLDFNCLQPEYTRFNIVSVISGLIEGIEIYSMPKIIKIALEHDLKSEEVIFDRIMLERILLNLISNSIKFIEESGTIKINLTDSEEAIIISLSDTGSGISSDLIYDIFNRYNTSDNSKGRGIGLSIVRDLVNLLGGKIHIESKLGEGTTITLVFPIKNISEEKHEDKIHSNNFYTDNIIKIELSE